MEKEKDRIDRQIAKVKLVNEGNGGIEVSYSWMEKRGHFDFLNEAPGMKYRAPVNQEVKEVFLKLKQHLIAVCYIDTQGDDILITGVTSNATDRFIISAKVRSHGGTFFAVNTPLMKEECGYDGFEDCLKVIQQIYDHVKEYVEKRLMATPQQIVMAFEKGNPEFNRDEFDGLDEQDQIERAKSILENRGHMVLPPDEIVDNPEEAESEGFGEDAPQTKVRKLSRNGKTKGERLSKVN